MKTMKKDKYENEYKPRYGRSAAKGALVYGPLYAVGVSGLAYAAAAAIGDEPASYHEVLIHSLLICPAFGAAGELLRRWIASVKSEEKNHLKKPRKRITVHRIKAYRRLQKAA